MFYYEFNTFSLSFFIEIGSKTGHRAKKGKGAEEVGR